MQEDLGHLVGLSERDLDLVIAEHLVAHDLGSQEDDDEERVFIAGRWFASLRRRLRSAICGQEAVERALENPGDNNQLLAAAIVDALLNVNFKVDVPVTVLAVKVAYVGVRKICSGDE
ncbi:hypothetical protein [Streptomyces gilvosporeus]|uniref:hypothetical protein n=1 Tax=Streptomyces gilvosporeus TaxID=553510 RepID=UPI00131C31A9|nr:hypothetical protein [Streptomyces gilvosporeus]